MRGVTAEAPLQGAGQTSFGLAACGHSAHPYPAPENNVVSASVTIADGYHFLLGGVTPPPSCTPIVTPLS